MCWGHQLVCKLMQIEGECLSRSAGAATHPYTEKYSITLMAQGNVAELHIVQPQREGDGRQALVVPPLYPAPATSLSSGPPEVLQGYMFITAGLFFGLRGASSGPPGLLV